MLEKLYVEAVLTDPKLAYRVWLLWAAGSISDEQAARAWLLMSSDVAEPVGERPL